MSAKKLKDTKLGAWLREKAPNVLDKVGDVLPDEGALGIVKNLISADEKDAAYAEAMADAEREAQANVTARASKEQTGAKPVKNPRPRGRWRLRPAAGLIRPWGRTAAQT